MKKQNQKFIISSIVYLILNFVAIFIVAVYRHNYRFGDRSFRAYPNWGVNNRFDTIKDLLSDYPLPIYIILGVTSILFLIINYKVILHFFKIEFSHFKKILIFSFFSFLIIFIISTILRYTVYKDYKALYDNIGISGVIILNLSLQIIYLIIEFSFIIYLQLKYNELFKALTVRTALITGIYLYVFSYIYGTILNLSISLIKGQEFQQSPKEQKLFNLVFYLIVFFILLIESSIIVNKKRKQKSINN